MGAKEKRYYQKNKDKPEFKAKAEERHKIWYEQNRIKDNKGSRDYYVLHRTEINRKRNLINKSLKAKCLLLIGDRCLICGRKDSLVFHEKHGKPHLNNLNVFLKNPKDFIPLCIIHHRTIHEIAKLSEEEFSKLISLVEELRL
jgi:hypothetical protein